MLISFHYCLFSSLFRFTGCATAATRHYLPPRQICHILRLLAPLIAIIFDACRFRRRFSRHFRHIIFFADDAAFSHSLYFITPFRHFLSFFSPRIAIAILIFFAFIISPLAMLPHDMILFRHYSYAAISACH